MDFNNIIFLLTKKFRIYLKVKNGKIATHECTIHKAMVYISICFIIIAEII